MRSRFRLIVALLFASGLSGVAIAGQLYKWVDEEGNVHYSDTPVEGADALDLAPPPSYDAPEPRPPRPRPSQEQAGEEDEGTRYSDVAFVSPKEDQVFWATGGEIPVYLSIEPGLLPGHRLILYFNGERTENSPLPGPTTTLTGVHRGAHTVRAVILDRDGKPLIEAGPVTFHVKQQSIQNPPSRAPKRRR